MPIQGRDLKEAALRFRAHINQVLSRTVTRTPVFVIPSEETRRVHVAFRLQGQPAGAPLFTHYGQMRLFLGQVCASDMKGGRHELRTVSYKYSLTREGEEEAFVRWGYVRTPEPEARWCRHHLQGPIPLLHVGEEPVTLDTLHFPTGYVLFEEVLRFCIVDLGVRPLSEDWHETLQASYDQFKQDVLQ